MSPRFRTVLRWMGAAALVAVPSAFAFGPLLPWSPVHPGYEELRTGRGRVLYPSGTPLPASFRDLDRMLAEAEQFHGYRAGSPVNVVLSGSWGAFRRSVPWIRGTGIGAVTLLTGDAVYITPAVDGIKRDYGEFLRHELSHAVLAQGGAILSSYRFSKRFWAYEGVAVWFGRQQAYFSQERFNALAPQAGVAKLLLEDDGAVDIRYRYILWRNFLDYIDQRRGRQSMRAFLQALNRDSSQLEAEFQSAFEGSLAETAAAFETAVLAGDFEPRRWEARP
ncbi:MAG: hypothetical protein R2729_09075 [Bryobacteraceae bacterium]